MKLSETREFLARIVRGAVHVPVMLVGSMGVGKSWVVKEVAEEEGVDCIDLRLAQQEPGDLIGLPRKEDGRTRWSKPEWWPADGTRGILFLDELNRAPVDVRQAVFQLVTEWKLHTHELPAGWTIASAINPDIGEYQVESLDIAMLRRFCQLRIIPDAVEWVAWADKYGMDRGIVDFIRSNHDLLLKKEEFTVEARPTPEGYRLIHLLRVSNAIPDSCRHEVLCGLVGTEAGTALFQFLKSGRGVFVGAMEILDSYQAVKERLSSQRHDEMSKTADALKSLLQDDGLSLTQPQLANLTAALNSLAPEWLVSIVTPLAMNVGLMRQLSMDMELAAKIVRLRGQHAKASSRPRKSP